MREGRWHSADLDFDQSVQCFSIISSEGWIFIQFPYSIIAFYVEITKPFASKCAPHTYESSPDPVACYSEWQCKDVGFREGTQSVLAMLYCSNFGLYSPLLIIMEDGRGKCQVCIRYCGDSRSREGQEWNSFYLKQQGSRIRLRR